MNQGIDKLTIADEMMESAIENYIDSKRYFCALNLAGVAQEIYGKLIRINGGAYSDETGPLILIQTGPPILAQSGPPVGAKRRWSFFV